VTHRASAAAPEPPHLRPPHGRRSIAAMVGPTIERTQVRLQTCSGQTTQSAAWPSSSYPPPDGCARSPDLNREATQRLRTDSRSEQEAAWSPLAATVALLRPNRASSTVWEPHGTDPPSPSSRSAAAMVAPGSVRTHAQLQRAGDASLCLILVGEPSTPRLRTLQHCSDIVVDAIVLSTETGLVPSFSLLCAPYTSSLLDILETYLYRRPQSSSSLFWVLAGHRSQDSRFAADGVRDLDCETFVYPG
jgi:hypothetical protein